jgi:hypothetical protein
MRDRGQMVPLAAALGALAMVLMVGVAGLGARWVTHQRVRQAADAAALAAVLDRANDVGAARALATANGARLASVRWVSADVVEVTVCVQRMCAVARATR